MTNTPAELRSSRWHQRPQCLASFGHSFILSISFFQHFNKIGCSADLGKPTFLWIRKLILPPYGFLLLLTPLVSDLTVLPVPPSALPHHSISSFFLSPRSSCSAASAYICSWAGAALGTPWLMATKPKNSWKYAKHFLHLWQKLGLLSDTQTLFLMLQGEWLPLRPVFMMIPVKVLE